MKFSDYYLSSGSRIFALLSGVLLALIAWIFCRTEIALLIGAGAAILASVLFPLLAFLSDLPYEKIKATFAKPFLIDERVRFSVEGGTVGGFLLLNRENLFLLSLERGRHILKFSRSDVRSVVLEEDDTISVFLDERRFVRVITDISEEIFEEIRKNGWNAITSQ